METYVEHKELMQNEQRKTRQAISPSLPQSKMQCLDIQEAALIKVYFQEILLSSKNILISQKHE